MGSSKIVEQPEEFEVDTLPEKKNIIIDLDFKDIDAEEIGYFIQFKKAEFPK